MRTATLILAGLLTMSPSAFSATNGPSSALTLQPMVDLALNGNPNLIAARARWEAMKERPAQQGALSNPMLTYKGMDAVNGNDFPDTNEKRLEVEQSFPWFGKRGLQKDAAAKEAEAMRYEYETMTRDVVMEVKESYFELCSVQKVLGIARAEEAVLQRLDKVAESMYSAGQTRQSDVLKAQSELTMLKQKLLETETQEATLTAKLDVLLDRRADTPLEIVAEPPAGTIDAGLDALFNSAETNRAEIARAQAELDRSQIEKRLMAKEYYPDYRLGAEYRSFSDNEPDMMMFMVGVDLPVWQPKYRAGVREAEKMIESNQSALEAARKQATLDVKQAHFNVRTAKQSLDLYQNTLIPQAKSRFEASEAGYKTGAVDFLDLLESERFLLNARTMEAMAEGNLGMQIARMERAVGTDLK